MSTKIEWTNITVNPWAGCTRVSPGCQNCYAERMAKRLKAIGIPHYQNVVDDNGWTGTIEPSFGAINKLSIGGKPKMIFLGSMTDIFHENVPDDALVSLFELIRANNKTKHTYQILTKRPKRALEFLKGRMIFQDSRFWLGVSVENQETADERIPILLQIPAAVRFVSVEPMLGPVDFSVLPRPEHFHRQPYGWHNWLPRQLRWVICGAETGPGARPMKYHWVRDLRDQSVDAQIPFFFKRGTDGKHRLDGVLWEQYPERSE